MCLKNKIVAAGLCALVAGIGIFATQGNAAQAQTNTSTATTADMSIEQLQQLVKSLTQQIQQMMQLIAQLKPQETCGNGICRFEETTASCPTDCNKTTTCAKEGETIYSAGKKCCDGLVAQSPCAGSGTDSSSGGTCMADSWTCVKPTTAICGNGACESGETIKNCLTDCKEPVSQNKCSIDSDCVSDSGTCHQCFNKTWWAAQSASAKRHWMCDGIGDAFCKCQSGACAVASVCGDRTCDTAKGETLANCPTDCKTGVNFVPASIVTSSTQPTGSVPATLTNTFNIQVTAKNGNVYLPKAGAFTVAVLKDSETDATKSHIGSVYIQPSGTVLTGSSYKIPQDTTATFSVTATHTTTIAGSYHLQMAVISWSTSDGGAYTNWVPTIPSIWAGQTVYLQGSGTSVCGNGKCETDETAINCSQDCDNSAVNGYNHHCEKLSDIKKGDVANLDYKQTSDFYNRYIMFSIDCPEVDGKRTSLSQGCTTCSNGTGKYCNVGTGGNGQYTYSFTSNLDGAHKVCTWPSSDYAQSGSSSILSWKVNMSLSRVSCGNGTCDSGETAASCVTDCGTTACIGENLQIPSGSARKCCTGLEKVTDYANYTCPVGVNCEPPIGNFCRKPTSKTCAQACATKGYGNSHCNAWAVGTLYADPNAGCKAGELNLNWQSDCTASGMTGGNRACCCSSSTACAVEGETIRTDGRKCCDGLVAQSPCAGSETGSSSSGICATDSWTCIKPIACAKEGEISGGMPGIGKSYVGLECCAGLKKSYGPSDSGYMCTAKCGNGTCDTSEKLYCPQDCSGKATCNSNLGADACKAASGKYYCVLPATCIAGSKCTSSCSCDCASVSVCGNGKCEFGETSTSCAADCGGCTSWSTVQDLGGVIIGNPDIVTAGDRLVIAGRGGDNALWIAEYNPGIKTTVPWYSLGGQIMGSPTLSAPTPWSAGSTIVVSAIGTDKNGWWRSGTTSKLWSDWQTSGTVGQQLSQNSLVQLKGTAYRLVLPGNAGGSSTANTNGSSVRLEKCDKSVCSSNLTGSLCEASGGKAYCGNGWCSCSCPTTACAVEGETIRTDGRKCCDGLVAQSPCAGSETGSSSSGICATDSWTCIKPTTAICGNRVCESSETSANCPTDCYKSASVEFVPASITTSSTEATAAAKASITSTFSIRVTAKNADAYIPKDGAFTVAVLKDDETDAAKFHIGSTYNQPTGTVAMGSSYKVPANTTVTFTPAATYSADAAGTYRLQMFIASWAGSDGGMIVNQTLSPASTWTSQSVYMKAPEAVSTCNNGYCDNGETASSCPRDCACRIMAFYAEPVSGYAYNNVYLDVINLPSITPTASMTLGGVDTWNGLMFSLSGAKGLTSVLKANQTVNDQGFAFMNARTSAMTLTVGNTVCSTSVPNTSVQVSTKSSPINIAEISANLSLIIQQLKVLLGK